MAKKKVESIDIDKDTEVGFTVIKLDPLRDKISRFLLALLGLRNVLFISSDKPVVTVNKAKPKAKKPRKKAV